MLDNLPESQLSVFIHFMQIDFKYMHPILSGNQVSNRSKDPGPEGPALATPEG
jgi:hypothetical protein